MRYLICTSLLALSACGTGDVTPHAVGKANPASEYCVSLGGKSQSVTRQDGQVGICTLPDGSKIEEWTLFRRDHPQGK